LVEGFGKGLVSVEGISNHGKKFPQQKKPSTLWPFQLPFEPLSPPKPLFELSFKPCTVSISSVV
jgi:hypothetical protein